MPLERIRQRFIQDLNMYPEFGGPRKSNNASEIISVSSSSSSTSAASVGSSVAPAAGKIRVQKGVIISDDESDGEVQEILAPVKMPVPQPYQQPKAAPAPATIGMPAPRPYQPYGSQVPTAPFQRIENSNTPYYKPAPYDLPPPKPPAKPIHIPTNRDLYAQSQPQAYHRQQSTPETIQVGDGEILQVPAAAGDNILMSSNEADKALRELMTGSMNEEAEVDMEDSVVEGFREDIRLLPHQIIGRAWMKDREDVTKKRSGGILADDMGLGKTIQTLTRIVEGRAKKSDKEDGWTATTLVICPLALVAQWASEIEKMATGLKVLKHHGTSRTSDPHELTRHHVVVTTYDVVKSEYDAYSPSAKNESKAKGKSKTLDESDDDDDAEHFGRTLAAKGAKKTGKAKAPKNALFNVKWWRIVLDEAHNIKNVKTKGAIACCELQGKFRWCLTGTPMQNNVTELYSLIKFLRIKPLSTWETFNEQIAKPVNSGRNAGRAMSRLQVVLKTIMLRRTKDQTLNGKKLIELPQRIVNVVSCPFDEDEKSFYDALEGKMESVIEKLMANSKGNSSYISVLLLLLRLRQACNHPILVAKDYKKDMEAVEPKSAPKGADDRDGDADDLVAAFGQLGVTRKCQMCTIELNRDNTGEGEWNTHCATCVPLAVQARRAEEERPSSAKIRMILKLLKDVDERSGGEEKTIIFSQFTSMLDLIEPFLQEAGIKYVRYDGSLSTDMRERALAKIKSSTTTRVILISFKAGSTGLNLTACNNVILVDLWWNPALEDQAFDRSHRFGQERDVNIFKLKIDNTVEDRILSLQDKKRALAAAALSGDKIKGMRLGMDDLLALFRPGGKDDDEEDYE
ncbi:SNF2 family N-terminal domain-containing protein [Crucibulum laeve]|uniref:SNF2 family N-terminal domain-containing protein n=1 Tax=Crucibulum laeve TaxID=68775 RepID=A0A5C3LH44_9AGAR|nr:SNF2 family N-terminal domain-containing protein [Crucibulum laeve]